MTTIESVKIDVSHASSKQSLHEILAAAFQFPGYYGKNWDAFWDCIRDPGQSRMPRHVVIVGIDSLEKKWPTEAKQLRECLTAAAAERGGAAFTVTFDR